LHFVASPDLSVKQSTVLYTIQDCDKPWRSERIQANGFSSAFPA
jgi:hypothetical protein